MTHMMANRLAATAAMTTTTWAAQIRERFGHGTAPYVLRVAGHCWSGRRPQHLEEAAGGPLNLLAGRHRRPRADDLGELPGGCDPDVPAARGPGSQPGAVHAQQGLDRHLGPAVHTAAMAWVCDWSSPRTLAGTAALAGRRPWRCQDWSTQTPLGPTTRCSRLSSPRQSDVVEHEVALVG